MTKAPGGTSGQPKELALIKSLLDSDNNMGEAMQSLDLDSPRETSESPEYGYDLTEEHQNVDRKASIGGKNVEIHTFNLNDTKKSEESGGLQWDNNSQGNSEENEAEVIELKNKPKKKKKKRDMENDVDVLEEKFHELEALLREQFTIHKDTLNRQLVGEASQFLKKNRALNQGLVPGGKIRMGKGRRPVSASNQRRTGKWIVNQDPAIEGTQTDGVLGSATMDYIEYRSPRRPPWDNTSDDGYVLIDTTVGQENSKRVTFVPSLQDRPGVEYSVDENEESDDEIQTASRARGRALNRSKTDPGRFSGRAVQSKNGKKAQPKKTGKARSLSASDKSASDRSKSRSISRSKSRSVSRSTSRSSSGSRTSSSHSREVKKNMRKVMNSDSELTSTTGASRSRSREKHTDHNFKNSDNTDIRTWLKLKEKELKKKKVPTATLR